MRRITSSEIRRAFELTPQITFEVTEGCNLRCKYCGYGELFEIASHRRNRALPWFKALAILEYYMAMVQHSSEGHYGREVFFSFFGGEPLLNFSLIEQVVGWVNRSGIDRFRGVKYSMTTNGLLLHGHEEFLVDNGFNLLISLDGDERASSYRKFPDGSSSFALVKKNIDGLKLRHPSYFEEHVKFNAVLNDRSSVGGIIDFIKSEYGKTPSISAINPIGVRPQYAEELDMMSVSVADSISASADAGEISNSMGIQSPFFRKAFDCFRGHSPYFYRGYNELLYGPSATIADLLPGGTCIPFSKRVFISAGGLIMPCENVSHKFALGSIDDDARVNIDFDELAQRYNAYYDELEPRCARCARNKSCSECIFHLPHGGDCLRCNEFASHSEMDEEIGRYYDFITSVPKFVEVIGNTLEFR